MASSKEHIATLLAKAPALLVQVGTWLNGIPLPQDENTRKIIQGQIAAVAFSITSSINDTDLTGKYRSNLYELTNFCEPNLSSEERESRLQNYQLCLQFYIAREESQKKSSQKSRAALIKYWGLIEKLIDNGKKEAYLDVCELLEIKKSVLRQPGGVEQKKLIRAARILGVIVDAGSFNSDGTLIALVDQLLTDDNYNQYVKGEDLAHNFVIVHMIEAWKEGDTFSKKYIASNREKVQNLKNFRVRPSESNDKDEAAYASMERLFDSQREQKDEEKESSPSAVPALQSSPNLGQVSSSPRKLPNFPLSSPIRRSTHTDSPLRQGPPSVPPVDRSLVLKGKMASQTSTSSGSHDHIELLGENADLTALLGGKILDDEDSSERKSISAITLDTQTPELSPSNNFDDEKSGPEQYDSDEEWDDQEEPKEAVPLINSGESSHLSSSSSSESQLIAQSKTEEDGSLRSQLLKVIDLLSSKKEPTETQKPLGEKSEFQIAADRDDRSASESEQEGGPIFFSLGSFSGEEESPRELKDENSKGKEEATESSVDSSLNLGSSPLPLSVSSRALSSFDTDPSLSIVDEDAIDSVNKASKAIHEIVSQSQAAILEAGEANVMGQPKFMYEEEDSQEQLHVAVRQAIAKDARGVLVLVREKLEALDTRSREIERDLPKLEGAIGNGESEARLAASKAQSVLIEVQVPLKKARSDAASALVKAVKNETQAINEFIVAIPARLQGAVGSMEELLREVNALERELHEKLGAVEEAIEKAHDLTSEDGEGIHAELNIAMEAAAIAIGQIRAEINSIEDKQQVIAAGLAAVEKIVEIAAENVLPAWRWIERDKTRENKAEIVENAIQVLQELDAASLIIQELQPAINELAKLSIPIPDVVRTINEHILEAQRSAIDAGTQAQTEIWAAQKQLEEVHAVIQTAQDAVVRAEEAIREARDVGPQAVIKAIEIQEASLRAQSFSLTRARDIELDGIPFGAIGQDKIEEGYSVVAKMLASVEAVQIGILEPARAAAYVELAQAEEDAYVELGQALCKAINDAGSSIVEAERFLSDKQQLSPAAILGVVDKGLSLLKEKKSDIEKALHDAVDVPDDVDVGNAGNMSDIRKEAEAQLQQLKEKIDALEAAKEAASTNQLKVLELVMLTRDTTDKIAAAFDAVNEPGLEDADKIKVIDEQRKELEEHKTALEEALEDAEGLSEGQINSATDAITQLQEKNEELDRMKAAFAPQRPQIQLQPQPDPGLDPLPDESEILVTGLWKEITEKVLYNSTKLQEMEMIYNADSENGGVLYPKDHEAEFKITFRHNPETGIVTANCSGKKGFPDGFEKMLDVFAEAGASSVNISLKQRLHEKNEDKKGREYQALSMALERDMVPRLKGQSLYDSLTFFKNQECKQAHMSFKDKKDPSGYEKTKEYIATIVRSGNQNLLSELINGMPLNDVQKDELKSRPKDKHLVKALLEYAVTGRLPDVHQQITVQPHGAQNAIKNPRGTGMGLDTGRARQRINDSGSDPHRGFNRTK